MPKKPMPETYCFSCESRILSEGDNFGPVCKNCYKKTKRRDLLMSAAIARTVVAVVPTVCPHEDQKHGKCKFGMSTACYFNVLVLNRNLEPVEITGPYTAKAAERRAKSLRRKKR